MDPDADVHLTANGLELEDNSGDGTIELQPLVTTGRYDGPRDAPEDNIATGPPRRNNKKIAFNKTNAAAAAANGTSPAVEQIASALSNEGINNALQRLGIFGSQTFATVKDWFTSSSTNNEGTPPVSSPSQTSASAAAQAQAEATSTNQKKMILLLMITLFVALLGATLEKYSAVEVELEIEEGEQENAFHEHITDKEHTTDDNNKPKVHIVNVDGYQPTEMVNTTNYILPGTENFPPLSAAKGRPYYPILNHFQYRNPTSSYASTWGYFDFQDPNPKWDGTMRPQPTNYHEVPNRDVANADFPDDAWQKDDEYMKAFLKQAKLLVNRTMEAVYAEYGVGIPQDGSITLSEEHMVNREKFFPFLIKDTINSPGGGSWSTKQSFDGIARRVIHHIMTGDTFKLVLGGHSAAAGHGAGFNQSYIIEAGHVLEPVFAHLGVEFRSYNFAQGGMGTLQQALAGMDLRNKEADWIYWDSSMTERPAYIINFFFRQALISGNRAPILMGEGQKLDQFHEVAGAAVAAQGNGWVPVTVSDEQVKEVPWAAKWLQCARGATTDCNAHQYDAGCWVEREDFKPPMPQGALVGGQAGWHPGNRIHKRRGRMIALVVLKSLEYALNKWETLGAESGFPIAEDHWHVTEYYKNIREKAVEVPGCWGNTWKIGQKRRLEEIEEEMETQIEYDVDGQRKLQDPKDFWPARICNLPLQGRSLWGPRNNPQETSLLTIMRKNDMGDIDPTPFKKTGYYVEPCYEPPDRPAKWTVPPASEPFAPLIAGSRKLELEEEHNSRQLRGVEGKETQRRASSLINMHEYSTVVNRTLAEGDDTANTTTVNKISPGYGLNVKWGRIGVCDGTSHHWCDKQCESGCLMGGAQDNRGMVCFDGFSGWLVFDVPNVKHGFIGARMEPWHGAEETPITAGWTEENNGGKGNYDKRGRERQLHEEYLEEQRKEGIARMEDEIEQEIHAEGDPTRRRLGGGQSCGGAADYTFEWAINGTIVSWNKSKFCEHFTRLNYNLDVIKFMDDETQTGNFELAMRMTNVGRGLAMCISHLYWA